MIDFHFCFQWGWWCWTGEQSGKLDWGYRTGNYHIESYNHLGWKRPSGSGMRQYKFNISKMEKKQTLCLTWNCSHEVWALVYILNNFIQSELESGECPVCTQLQINVQPAHDKGNAISSVFKSLYFPKEHGKCLHHCSGYRGSHLCSVLASRKVNLKRCSCREGLPACAEEQRLPLPVQTEGVGPWEPGQGQSEGSSDCALKIHRSLNRRK